jgi:hypothetical protein
MGMIYLNEEDINIEGMMEKWKESNQEAGKYF